MLAPSPVTMPGTSSSSNRLDPFPNLMYIMGQFNTYNSTIQKALDREFSKLASRHNELNERAVELNALDDNLIKKASDLEHKQLRLEADRLEFDSHVDKQERDFAQRTQDFLARDPVPAINDKLDILRAEVFEMFEGLEAKVTDNMNKVASLQQAVQEQTEGTERLQFAVQDNTEEATGLQQTVEQQLEYTDRLRGGIVLLRRNMNANHRELMELASSPPGMHSQFTSRTSSHKFTGSPPPMAQSNPQKRKQRDDLPLPTPKRQSIKREEEEEVWKDAPENPSPEASTSQPVAGSSKTAYEDSVPQ
jgi:FtsZ-binding cell division protein ZapB